MRRLAPLLLVLWLAGCATGKEKEPIVTHEKPGDVLRAKLYDAWSARSPKGSVYVLFELTEGWTFRRPPTPQVSAGGVQVGRYAPAMWEMTFQPMDQNYRLASGVVTLMIFWEATGKDGAVKAGRTRAVVSISENLAVSVLEFGNEEKAGEAAAK